MRLKKKKKAVFCRYFDLFDCIIKRDRKLECPPSKYSYRFYILFIHEVVRDIASKVIELPDLFVVLGCVLKLYCIDQGDIVFGVGIY